MAFQVHHKPPLPTVPLLSTILVHISLLLSCFHLKPCMCSGTSSHKEQLGNLTMSYAFDQVPGYLFLSESGSCNQAVDTVWGGLGSYMNAYYPDFDLSQTGWFFPIFSMDQSLDDSSVSNGASFSIAFSMTTYQPNHLQAKASSSSSILFTIRPVLYTDNLYETYEDVMFDEYENYTSLADGNATSANVAGSLVSSKITVNSIENVIWVRVGIEKRETGSSVPSDKYTVWVDYHHAKKHISVYVAAGEGAAAKPANQMASMDLLNTTMPSEVSFGFSSSMGQLLQLRTWNSTFRRLPLSCYPSSSSAYHNDPAHDHDQQSFPQPRVNNLAVILSSVLGSAAATATTAAAVYVYFTSKYRKWKKEHDKLAKTMRCLPGVPSQIDYADINKATKSFHETMKLGKGGFGAVYRCTLPVAASRTGGGRSMDVAVKKFMRELEDRRYDDFLAEVSIINRLRHKNIVPLIGWSYNKGEPILIYEYMRNGSLDQHLFLKGGTSKQRQQQQQQEDTSLDRWQTRYSIAKDIATGLHYVHHEHEPTVLHRDIKASNIMLDSTLHARLGDFGIASTVAVDRSSVTGIAGTWGYMAPEYAMTYRSTRHTDTYAFGVLVLEVVTGKKNGDVPPGDDHITDWVWRLHRERKLLEAVDGSAVLAAGDDDSARRLLLLGLACANPNPSNRPSMAEVLQVITKLAPPPDVPLERPSFMWPPEDWRCRNSVYSTAASCCDASSESTVELARPVEEQPPPSAAAGGGEHASAGSRVASGRLASAN